MPRRSGVRVGGDDELIRSGKDGEGVPFRIVRKRLGRGGRGQRRRGFGCVDLCKAGEEDEEPFLMKDEKIRSSTTKSRIARTLHRPSLGTSTNALNQDKTAQRTRLK